MKILLNTIKQALLQPCKRKCRFYVPNKNSGKGAGSLRPSGLNGGRGDDTWPDQTGGSLRPGRWGDRRPWTEGAMEERREEGRKGPVKSVKPRARKVASPPLLMHRF